MEYRQTIARVGQTNGNQQITEDMLRDVVETWDQVGRAPITFGRPRSQEGPKAGNVIDLRLTDGGKRLEADLLPLKKVQQEAPDTFLDSPTVAIARAEDGTHYLHHVEGGHMPPGIRESLSGLPGLRMSDPMRNGLTFADGEHVERFSDRQHTREVFQQM